MECDPRRIWRWVSWPNHLSIKLSQACVGCEVQMISRMAHKHERNMQVFQIEQPAKPALSSWAVNVIDFGSIKNLKDKQSSNDAQQHLCSGLGRFGLGPRIEVGWNFVFDTTYPIDGNDMQLIAPIAAFWRQLGNQFFRYLRVIRR